MKVRDAGFVLIAALALLHALIVFNNISDFDTNYQFVRHVLMMDSIFPDSHGRWRALNSPSIHLAFYISIIVWELAATVLLSWGAARMFRARRAPAAAFQRAKQVGILGLTMSMLLWLTAFTAIGGEWFLMWQSRLWNGQESAFRNFALDALVLIVLVQADRNEPA